jgi:hypothetical protein
MRPSPNIKPHTYFCMGKWESPLPAFNDENREVSTCSIQTSHDRGPQFKDGRQVHAVENQAFPADISNF